VEEARPDGHHRDRRGRGQGHDVPTGFASKEAAATKKAEVNEGIIVAE